MPIYEYECENCGQIQEALQKISEKPLCTCKHCSGKLHKLVSHSSFHLKGSGWYVTDYAKKSVKKTETSSSHENKTTSETTNENNTVNPKPEKKSTPE